MKLIIGRGVLLTVPGPSASFYIARPNVHTTAPLATRVDAEPNAWASLGALQSWAASTVMLPMTSSMNPRLDSVLRVAGDLELQGEYEEAARRFKKERMAREHAIIIAAANLPRDRSVRPLRRTDHALRRAAQ